MKVVTEPVMIAGYGVWDMEDGPATRADGSVVEKVTVLDVESGDARQISLDRSVGEDGRPGIGSFAELVCRVELSQKGGKDGIVRTKDRWTVCELKPASVSKNGSGSRERASQAAQAA